jgi:hypothetical protein
MLAHGAAALLFLGAAATALARTDVLTYNFQPGDLLYYDCTTVVTDDTTGSEVSRRVDAVRIWCVAATDRIQTLLIERQREVDGRIQPTRGIVLQLDANGRRTVAPAARPDLDPLDDALYLLPGLPIGAQLAREWRTPPDHHARVWHTRVADPTANVVTLNVVVEEPRVQATLLQQRTTGTLQFDTAQHCVVTATIETLDQRRGQRSRYTARLRERTQQSRGWAERRGEECQRYVRALEVENSQLKQLFRGDADAAEAQTALAQHWQAFQSELDNRAMSPLIPLAVARRQAWQQALPDLQILARLGRAWWQQPALPWTLQDAAGETRTSEALRTGVVIECFWSSTNRASFSALRATRELQADLQPFPVTVITYNMDRDWPRARTAVAQLGDALPHLLGGALWQTEPAFDLPLIRVLDRQQRVRGVWFEAPAPPAEIEALTLALAQERQTPVPPARRNRQSP